MSEKALWQMVKGKLGPYGDLVRIENSVGLGVPDINYCLTDKVDAVCEGWIELKEINHFPKRHNHKKTDIDHFTKEQRLWLKRRSQIGGNVYLFLRTLKPKRHYYLFDGHSIWSHNELNEREIINRAMYNFGPGWVQENTETLLKYLIWGTLQ